MSWEESFIQEPVQLTVPRQGWLKFVSNCGELTKEEKVDLLLEELRKLSLAE